MVKKCVQIWRQILEQFGEWKDKNCKSQNMQIKGMKWNRSSELWQIQVDKEGEMASRKS
jgi:hypothetical protein